MDYVKKRTHIINHVRFTDAGPIARDLYDWGMLWSGQQETDGEIPMSAVLVSPWGYGGKANIKAAVKLVEVGLWERTDKGFRVLKWEEQGNPTKASLDRVRAKARERMKGARGMAPRGLPSLDRSDDVRANCERTSHEVPSSPSTSLSLSGSSGRDPEPRRLPTPAAGGDRPAWAEGAFDGAEMSTGETFDRGIVWTKYQASRERDRKPEGAADLRSFLASWAATQKSSRVKDRERGPASARHERQPLGSVEDHPWLKTGGGEF